MAASSNKQTKEEFLSQFQETSEIITIKVRWAWSKGSSRFDSFGKEELIHIHYTQPWAATDDMPFGPGGTIYWFGKKKLFGYPYPPEFKQGTCYRVRVRKCKADRRFYLLEEVVAKSIDLSADEGIYNEAYSKFSNLLSDEKKDVLIYCANNADVSKAKRAGGMAIGYAYVDYSAIIDEEGGSPKMVGRLITIPYDDKKFAENKRLKFKAGSIYKLRVIPYKNSSVSMALDEVLEESVINEELASAGKESLKPAKWSVEGFGEFTTAWDKIQMRASKEDIKWNLYTGKQCFVSVYLQCDEDNCHTAYKSTERFLSFCKDKATLEKKILEAVADDLVDDDGTVETWNEEAGTISKENLISRISLSVLSFEEGGIDILLDLDDLFTDHGYSLYMNYDGTITINGLWG